MTERLEAASKAAWVRCVDLAPPVAVSTLLAAVAAVVDDLSPLVMLVPVLVMWVAAAMDAVEAITKLVDDPTAAAES